MRCKYSITFEFTVKQPISISGEVQANSVRTIAARALDEATEKHPGLNWSSLVILLERSQSDEMFELSEGIEESKEE